MWNSAVRYEKEQIPNWNTTHREAVQGVAQRLAHTLQPIQDANRRQHMGGVGTLAAPGLKELSFPTHRQQRIKEELFCTAGKQASTKFTQHGMVKPGIGQFQI